MSSHERARRATTAGPVTPTRRRLQARLEVGAVDDPMEAEAEATADRVLSTIQAGGGAPAVAAAARAEDEELLQGHRIARVEEEEPLQGYRIARVEEEEPLQGYRIARAGMGPEGGAVDPELEARLTAGGGGPLPEPVKTSMEAAFGADFSAVRVSENPAAADIGALAYTTGPDVRFAPGRFQPGTPAGQHLLAHELTHVVQQGAAAAAPAGASARAARATAQREPVEVAKLSFEQIMAAYRMPYRDFLTRQYAVENLDFLEAVEGGWPTDMIIETFLLDTSPKQINVSNDQRLPVVNGEKEPDTICAPVIALLKANLGTFKSDPEVQADFSRM